MIKFKSIKSKLYFAFITLLLLSGFVALFAFFSIQTVIQNTSVINSTDSVRVLLRDLKNYEKEFLLHESIDSVFYKTHKSQNLQKAESHYAIILNLYQDLSKNQSLQQDSVKLLIQSLKKDLQIFIKNYRSLVELRYKIGFKNWGLEGKLRNKIHQVEKANINYDQRFLLMLRRHEKDFFLRKDDQYIDVKFQSAVLDFINHLNKQKVGSNSAVIQNLVDKVRDYQKELLTVRKAYKSLGYHQYEGIQGKLQNISDMMERRVARLHTIIQEKSARITYQAQSSFLSMFMIQLILVLYLGFRFLNRISKRIFHLNNIILQLADGKLTQKYHCSVGDELSETFSALNLLNRRIEEATFFTDKIGQDNQDVEYSPEFRKGVLEKALIHMKNTLKQAAIEKQKSNWIDKSLAQFIEIFKQNQNIQSLTKKTISCLVKHIHAAQGAIFLSDAGTDNPVLELKACYACCVDKFRNTTILFGEGLIGQVFKEGKTVYLNDLPSTYTQVKTGLGSVSPKNLLIVPIKIDTKILGVIELVSLHEFETHQITFIEKLVEYMAIFMFTMNLPEYQLDSK
ncbi:MAG: GAF domain-containing protein [Microscillaceae bacterium]|nr:GAF domain-containing protein [Microscillaceae bacterium]